MVGLCTCTVAIAPGTRFPNVQFKSTPGLGRVIVHVPGPAKAGLIVQANPELVGSGSCSCTLNAVPVPAALLLLTVIVKPIGFPVATGVPSAVLVTLRLGGGGGCTTMVAIFDAVGS